MNDRGRAAGSAMLVAVLGIGYGACAQDYPVKPVRILVPGPAGGGGDVITRPLAQRLGERMGQHFVVENRPGAGGALAGQIAMAAAADGYTLLLCTGGGFSIAPFVGRKPPYDPERDFAPITNVASAPMMIAVHPSLPANSVAGLVSLAKRSREPLFYASNGQASFSHLASEYFRQVAGLRLTHVPYKGGTPAVMDTVGGQVHLIITALPTLMAQVKASRLRAIAVTGPQRLAVMPDLPTVAESGYPGFVVLQWYGMVAPRGTPASVRERLYDEIRRAADAPALQTLLAQEGAELMIDGPVAQSAFLTADIARWRQVIREARIVLE